MAQDGLLIVISGPSASGKTTVCEALRARLRCFRSVSVTTRGRRQGEVEGKDYFFVSGEEFQRRVREGEFLEHAFYCAQAYGTPKKPVDEALARGEDALLSIEVQGTLKVKEKYPRGLFFFLLPPSPEALRRRLEARGREVGPELEERLRVADWEMGFKDRYDHAVVNDRVDRAVEEILGLIGERKARRL